MLMLDRNLLGTCGHGMSEARLHRDPLIQGLYDRCCGNIITISTGHVRSVIHPMKISAACVS